MGDVIDFHRQRNLLGVKKGLQELVSGYDGQPYTEALRGEVEGEVRAFLTEREGVPEPWRVVDSGCLEDQMMGVIRMNVVFSAEKMEIELAANGAP